MSCRIIPVFLFILTVCHGSYLCSGFPGKGCKLHKNLISILVNNFLITADTYPVGDIFIEYNTSTPLEITCVINNEDIIRYDPNISSKLYFKKGDADVPSDKVIFTLIHISHIYNRNLNTF